MSIDVIKECMYLCPFCYEQYRSDDECCTHIVGCKPDETNSKCLKVVTSEGHLCTKCLNWFNQSNECFLHALSCSGKRESRDAATMVTETDVLVPSLKHEQIDEDNLLSPMQEYEPKVKRPKFGFPIRRLAVDQPSNAVRRLKLNKSKEKRELCEKETRPWISLVIARHLQSRVKKAEHSPPGEKHKSLKIDGHRFNLDRRFAKTQLGCVNPNLRQWRCGVDRGCPLTCQTEKYMLVMFDGDQHQHAERTTDPNELAKHSVAWFRHKDNERLIVDGYPMLSEGKVTNDGTRYWFCSSQKTKNCPARAITRATDLLSLKDRHNHDAEPNFEQKIQMYETIEQIVQRNPTLAPCEVITEARSIMDHIPMHQQPTYKQMAAIVCNRRQQVAPRPKCPILEGEALSCVNYSFERGPRGGEVLVIDGYWHYKQANNRHKVEGHFRWLCEFSITATQRKVNNSCWARATTRNGQLINIKELPHTHPPRVEPLPTAITDYRAMLNTMTLNCAVNSDNERPTDQFTVFTDF